MRLYEQDAWLMNGRLEKHGYALFKVIRERLLVQEHPGILVLSVKLVL